MPYLLDTVAVSETRKPQLNPGYVAWLEARDVEETFIGAPTLGELFEGIPSLKPSAVRDRLTDWLSGVIESYEGRIIPLDAAAARVWGEAMGNARRKGRPLPIVDSQLAAIALVNKLTVVTRNVRDFDISEFHGLDVINPWS